MKFEECTNASSILKCYLTLIAASKGCRSVRRTVADLIPQYACYCSTALEAAAEVIINMHNWSLALINKEDCNGIAFATFRACIFGLADICCTASSMAPKSTVVKGINSAVFQNVLTFFMMALFEGKDVMHLVDKNFLNMQDSIEVFKELKHKNLDEDECSLIKLPKSCALSLLWIFFSCPKDLLATCLELSGCAAKEKASIGQHFLGLVTSTLDMMQFNFWIVQIMDLKHAEVLLVQTSEITRMREIRKL